MQPARQQQANRIAQSRSRSKRTWSARVFLSYSNPMSVPLKSPTLTTHSHANIPALSTGLDVRNRTIGCPCGSGYDSKPPLKRLKGNIQERKAIAHCAQWRLGDSTPYPCTLKVPIVGDLCDVVERLKLADWVRSPMAAYRHASLQNLNQDE